MPSTDETGHYDSAKHAVEVSEGLLLHQKTEQNIEYIMTHELGHACQYSRGRYVTGALNVSCLLNVTNVISQDMLDNTLGVKTKECLVEALNKEELRRAKAKEGDMCMGSWMREAFADAIFLPRLRDLSHWARSCNSSGDDIHAPPATYMHCLMNRWPLNGHFCPKSETKK